MSVPLLEPREGLPPLVVTAEELEAATQRLRSGTGPVAVDAERASGFRYGHRAFLVQLRRPSAGTVLIDPVACPDLSGIDEALAGIEAVLHAANQDLPCLADLGFRPQRIFDTELAGRLLGYPRVGLGTLVEEVLGLDAGEDALGGRLVDQAAAGRMAPLRGPGRGGAGRAAGRAGRAARRAGQDRVGRAGIRRDPGRQARSAAS